MTNKWLGYFLIFLGLSFLLWFLYLVNQRYAKTTYTPSVVHTENTDISKLPEKITIKSLNINLFVKSAELTNGKWEDTKGYVAYWNKSVLPGEQGNSVFYGHNWPSVFGNLKNIKKGNSIEIQFTDGSVKDFIVDSTYIITADETHILEPTDDTRLTIYTCTGFLDLKRFVVIAVSKNA